MLNLANMKIHGTTLPDGIFEFFWMEKAIDRGKPDTWHPKFIDLMVADFGGAIEVLPYIGPLNTDNDFLGACAVKAVAYMVREAPEMARLVHAAGEDDLMTEWAKGTFNNLGAFENRLHDKWQNLRMERNKLQDAVEPTFMDKLELENVLRRLHVVCALQDILGAIDRSYSQYGFDWRRFAKGGLWLQEATSGTWMPRTEKVFGGDTKQTVAWKRHFATVFLEVYTAPKYQWQL